MTLIQSVASTQIGQLGNRLGQPEITHFEGDVKSQVVIITVSKPLMNKT